MPYQFGSHGESIMNPIGGRLGARPLITASNSFHWWSVIAVLGLGMPGSNSPRASFWLGVRWLREPSDQGYKTKPPPWRPKAAARRHC